MKKNIITIAGLPGSGKSSAADEVARMLSYQRFSSGDFWRQIAKDQNISVEELNKRAEKDPSVDYLVDEAVQKAGLQDKIVIDSRLAFHWIPDSFKVFLKIDPHAAAQRTFTHMKEGGRVSQTANSVEEVYQKTIGRIESERTRYATLYGITYSDESQFDISIDTTSTPLKEVAERIVSAYRAWLSN